MAKLIETIEGYNPEMTPEEKIAFFEGVDAPETPPAPRDAISKKRFDEVASELAAAKRALKSKMTEEEQRAEEIRQQQTEMQEELEKLRKERTVNAHKANFLGLGFESDAAMEAAAALTEGDTETVFTSLKKVMDTSKRTWQAEILKNTPRPPASESEAAAKRAKDLELRKSFGLPV